MNVKHNLRIPDPNVFFYGVWGLRKSKHTHTNTFYPNGSRMLMGTCYKSTGHCHLHLQGHWSSAASGWRHTHGKRRYECWFLAPQTDSFGRWLFANSGDGSKPKKYLYIYIYGSYGGFQKYLKIKLPRALQVMDDHDFVAEHPGRGRGARLAASAGGARVRFSWEKHRKQFGTAT